MLRVNRNKNATSASPAFRPLRWRFARRNPFVGIVGDLVGRSRLAAELAKFPSEITVSEFETIIPATGQGWPQTQQL